MISTLFDLLANFYARNDFTNFEAIARNLLNAVPNDQVSLQFLGLAYYRTGRVKDAIRIFNKVVLRRKPAKSEAEVGNASLASGDHAAAACYQEATRHSPELSQAWFDLGTALLELGKCKQAVPAFHNALLAEPESIQAMLALGQTALLINDLKVAEENFSGLQELQPNNADAYQGLGQVYRKRRDFATARACFVRVRLLQGGSNCIDNLSGRRTADGESNVDTPETRQRSHGIKSLIAVCRARIARRKVKIARRRVRS